MINQSALLFMYHDKVKCTSSGYLPGNYSKSYIEYTSFIVLHQSIRNCKQVPVFVLSQGFSFFSHFPVLLYQRLLGFCMFFNSHKHEIEHDKIIYWNNINIYLSQHYYLQRMQKIPVSEKLQLTCNSGKYLNMGMQMLQTSFRF